MATSPAPNAAAPPGMCPGIVVKGGGGGSGDGDGSGSGGNDGAGGDGSGDGKGGNGDGKGGAACGAGSEGGCTSCGHKVAGGDPIDLATGEMFTERHADLSSPGFIELVFIRWYSSRRRSEDVGVGYGWTHTFAWRFERRGRKIRIDKGGGNETIVLAVPTVGEPTRLGDWILSTNGGEYLLDTGEDYTHIFSPADAKGSRYLLTRIEHISKNGFRLEYDANGHLTTVFDSADRPIVLDNDPNGRLVALSMTAPRTGARIVFGRYEYDADGDLVRFTDADGFTTTYAYDNDHRMVRQTHPDGPTFHYVYDRQGRCIESWVDYDGQPDPALAKDLPPYLEDGRTRAKGFAHIRLEFSGDGYVEYSNSKRFRRFFVDSAGNIRKAVDGNSITENVFDEHGNIAARRDALDATFTYKHDELGRLLEETDPIGRTFLIERDERGRVVRNVDFAGNEISCVRDWRGNVVAVTNQRGATTTYDYDERGRIICRTDAIAGVTRYVGDDMGNLVMVVQPNGATWRFEYDYFGRMFRRTDPLGRIVLYAYSPSGRVLRAEQEDKILEYEYNGLGCITRVSAPEGTYHIRWGGLRWPYERIDPNGDSFRAEYNREGWVIRHFNRADEVYAFDYDRNGSSSGVARFDGGTVEAKYDLARRRIRRANSAGDVMSFERDALGRIAAVEHSDGRAVTFEYRLAGELACATTPEGVFRFEYDEVGNVIAEHQEVDGVTHWVKARYDLENHLVGIQTSLDHEVSIERDSSGERRKVVLDRETTVMYERNPLGLETALCLSNGARVETEYDARYRVARRRVTRPFARHVVGPGEPDWIGEEESGIVVAANNLVAVIDRHEGSTAYTYDSRGQLQAKVPQSGAPELLRYVRYVWFEQSLLHEITTTAKGERSVRTYAHTDRRFQPWAHREQGPGEPPPGPWCFYVGDILSTPEKIITGDGTIVGSLERSAFGVTRVSPSSSVTTAMRFAGQYADEETGLHYNFHRYYDPETGRYISPDPVGLNAGENHFLYCSGDPIGRVDPFGLGDHGVDCSIDIKNGGDKNGTWVPHSDPATPLNPKAGCLESSFQEKKQTLPIPGASRAGEPPINTGGAHGPTGNKGMTYAHTEQHACEWAEKNFPGALKDSHMKMEGGLPPCPRCNDRMAKFAKDHTATVDYSWPDNNKFQYTGAGGPNSVGTGTAPSTDPLAKAYQNRNNYTLAGQSPPKGKSGQKEYDDAKKDVPKK